MPSVAEEAEAFCSERYSRLSRIIPPPPQWEKSYKFVPLGKKKKNIFENQIKFV
jgi:hypothetical protein